MKNHIKNIARFGVTCLAFFLCACQPTTSNGKEEDDQELSHSDIKDDEELAYLLPDLDHGLLQSPINIISKESTSGKHNITINFSGDIDNVKNLGHTVQLNLEPGNTITVDGKTFEYKQMHFHTPSEHLIDGITYPMEMHVVNTLKDQQQDETTEYLVIAFHIKMGGVNKFLGNFIDNIPKDEGGVTEVDLNALTDSEMSNAANLLKELNSYYYYKGSLTTPPYTESVNWYVMKRIFEASPEQIKRINEIEGDNARHIQEKYERKISEE